MCTTPYSARNKLLFARLNRNEEQPKKCDHRHRRKPKTRFIYPKFDFFLREFFLSHTHARSPSFSFNFRPLVLLVMRIRFRFYSLCCVISKSLFFRQFSSALSFNVFQWTRCDFSPSVENSAKSPKYFENSAQYVVTIQNVVRKITTNRQRERKKRIGFPIEIKHKKQRKKKGRKKKTKPKG